MFRYLSKELTVLAICFSSLLQSQASVTLSNSASNNGDHSSIEWRVAKLYEVSGAQQVSDGDVQGTFQDNNLLYYKDSVTFTATAWAGWNSSIAFAKQEGNGEIPDFADYLDSLDEASLVAVNTDGTLGVRSPAGYTDSEHRMITDTHEAIIITVNLSELATTTTLTLESIQFAVYHAASSDRTDFLIYDASEDKVIEAQRNANYNSGDKVSGNWVLEDGDKIIIAAGEDNVQGFRFSSLTFDLTSSLQQSPNPNPIPELLPNIATYTYTGYIGFDSQGNEYLGEEHDIEVTSPDNHYEGDGKPVYIWFHGGSWSRGGLSQGRPFCDYLTGRGMVTVNANYTLPGNREKQICIMDAKTVIRWVKENANELGIDPNKVVVGGYSAGGHISVLQMVNDTLNNASDDLSISTEVQGVMVICPAFSYLGADTTSRDDVNAFSYLNYEYPPTLMMVGQDDSWEVRSDDLAVELLSRGQPIEVWMAMNIGHELVGAGVAQTAMRLRMDAFLRDLGYLEGEPTLTISGSDVELDFHRALPEVSIVNPSSPTQEVSHGYTTINIDVIASNLDKDGDESGQTMGIQKVELFLNDVSVGSQMSEPYQWSGSTTPQLLGLTAGDYTVKAVATDYENNTRESDFILRVETPLTYGDWEASYSISGVESGKSGDFDGDGFSNYYEFLFGLDPTKSYNPRLPQGTAFSDKARFSYTYRTDALVNHTLQSSTDLVTWEDHLDFNIISTTDNGDGTSTRTLEVLYDAAEELEQFFRINAVEQ